MGTTWKRAAAACAVAVAAGTALAGCGGDGGYAPAYVVGETYCPGNPFATCVVMSDGDIVGPVGQSLLADVLYGMVLSPYSGGYRFTRQPSAVTNVSYHRITVVQQAVKYAGRKPVTPAAEASAEKSGDTYSAGGKSYPRSPAALKRKAVQARALASKVAVSRAAASRYAKQQREPQDGAPAGYRKPATGGYKVSPRLKAGK
jgi:hypothetical protein